MPAYFEVTFEVPKGPNVIYEFYHVLMQSGLTFKSGFWGFEEDALEDILNWNQKKMDADFEIGFEEHHSHDYKQIQFEFGDFSEARVFILNTKNAPSFSVLLIVPEDDLIKYEKNDDKYNVIRNTEKMSSIMELVKKVWTDYNVLSIQTGWECSDCPPKYAELSEDRLPQIEPFAIIPRNCVSETYLRAQQKDSEQLDIKVDDLERDGILLVNDKAWNYL